MADLKTQKTELDPEDFLRSVEHPKRSADSWVLLKMMRDITGDNGSMWGPSIIGFGSYKYTYSNGKSIDWMLCGFSPRKQSLSVYIMSGFDEYDEILSRLGKFKTGKSCLYINKLEDVDQSVLKELIQSSVDKLRDRK